MNRQRLLMLVRLALGVLLLRQAVIGMSDLPHLAQTMELHSAWRSWPLFGGMRPMEVALWIAGLEFAAGVFLIGGLVTRLMALLSTLLAFFALATLGDLGLAPNLAHAALLLASLLVLVKGGGSATMDRLLGQMQRRSMEREAEREAARRAALQHAGSKGGGST